MSDLELVSISQIWSNLDKLEDLCYSLEFLLKEIVDTMGKL